MRSTTLPSVVLQKRDAAPSAMFSDPAGNTMGLVESEPPPAAE